MRLPRKPQYVLVKLDADMAPEGPLRYGKWPVAHGRWTRYYEHVLTYHYLGEGTLKRGDRICVSGGLYEECFGTVLGKSPHYSGYTYPVRRASRKTLTLLVQTEQTTEVEVA